MAEALGAEDGEGGVLEGLGRAEEDNPQCCLGGGAYREEHLGEGGGVAEGARGEHPQSGAE